MGIFTAIKYVIILAIVIAIGAGLWYVMNLKADLATSEANNKQLEVALQEQGAVLAQMKKDVEQIKTINEDLSKQKEDLQKDKEVLTSKFSKRDFGALAAEKPNVIERLVNRGTVNAMRCLEIASGSPLTEKELAAKTPTEANRECPALINPAYTAPN
jgi:predicted phage gp36 major capsid-like protein